MSRKKLTYIGVPVFLNETVTIGLDMLFDYSDQKRNDAVWKLRERALGKGHHDGDEVVIPGVLGWDVGIRRSSSNDPRIDAVLAEHGWQDKKWFLDREDADILKEISTLESEKPDHVNLNVAIPRLKSMLGTKSWWSKQLPGPMKEIEAWVPVCVVAVGGRCRAWSGRPCRLDRPDTTERGDTAMSYRTLNGQDRPGLSTPSPGWMSA